MSYKESWLPDLKGAIPLTAYGIPLSLYSVALEGWRRGLTLKFFHKYYNNKWNIRFSLKNGRGHEREFIDSSGDLNTYGSHKMCIDQHLTREFLTEAGVSIRKGKSFHKDSSESDIKKFASTIGYPLTINPKGKTLGKLIKIQNENQLIETVQEIRQTNNGDRFLVEEIVEGDYCRFYVLEDQVVGAIKYIPAHVTGDGKSSIRDLIQSKNEKRKQNPSLKGGDIKINKELKNYLQLSNLTVDSIPQKGTKIFLSENHQVQYGGETEDITDKVPMEIRKLAVQTIIAIPGLAHGAIEMVMTKNMKKAVVHSVIARALISEHLFPVRGEARDIPSAIIDYYFPETMTERESKKTRLFFDFKSIITPLENGLLDEITVPSVPKYTHQVRAFLVSGEVQGVGYRNWVERKALSLQLNGFVKNLNNGKVQVVISGPKDNIAKFRSIITTQSPSTANVGVVTEKIYEKPIKIGFEIKR